MILSCPACRTRYVVPDSAIGTSGRQVRCASCKHSWFQDPPLLDLVARVEAETLAQPPSPEAMPSAPAPLPAPAEPEPPLPPLPAFAVPPGEADAETIRPPMPPLAPREDSPAVASEHAEPDFDAFAPEPLIRRRRSRSPRLWTLAAALAALLLVSGVAALQFLGSPAWLAQLGLPVGSASTPLLLEMPRKPYRRTTPSGNELFELSGRVVNPTNEAQRVPDIIVELSDPQGRVIYGWTITPSQRTLAPKGTLNFDSAQIDVPKGAKAINFLFAGEDGK